MLCSFALFDASFGFIGPEKSHWGSDQLRYSLSGQHSFRDYITEISPLNCYKLEDYPLVVIVIQLFVSL